MKRLTRYYYPLLNLTLLFAAFTIALRDVLLRWMFNSPKDASVTDTVAYAGETAVANVMVWTLWAMMVAVAAISIVLLFRRSEKSPSRIVLISVPLVVALLAILVSMLGTPALPS